MTDTGNNNYDTQDAGIPYDGDQMAIDGLLRELARGGDGVDELFVGRVLSNLEQVLAEEPVVEQSAQLQLKIVRGSTTSSRTRARKRKADSIFLWPRLITAIAASFAIIAGGWWLLKNYEQTSQRIARSEPAKPEVKVPRRSVRKDTVAEKPLVASTDSEAPMPPEDKLPGDVQEDTAAEKPLVVFADKPLPEKKIPADTHKTPVVQNRMIAYLTITGSGVTVLRGGQEHSIASSWDLYENDTIIVSSKGIATVEYEREKTALTILPNTRLKLSSANMAKRIELEKGTVGATVAGQRADKPMVFRTAQAFVRVLGTRLVLTADDARTRVDVLKGRLKIIHARSKESKIVTAGKFAEAWEPGAAGGELVIGKTKLKVAGFTLINADTNEPVEGYDPMEYGSEFFLADMPTSNLKVRVNTEPAIVGSVYVGYPRKERDGAFWDTIAKRSPHRCLSENSYPYVFSCSSGRGKEQDLTIGKHTIVAVACKKKGALGNRSDPVQIFFTVR